MPEKLIFQEWQDQQADSAYPFADNATLTNGVDTIPKGLFVDARLYVIAGGARQFLSSVVVSTLGAYLNISDENETVIATGYLDFGAIGTTIELLDPYGRPAGILVSPPAQLGTLASWTVGEHAFALDETEFTATVVVPQPQIGVRGFLVEGELFAGDTYLVGEQGVFLTLDQGYIRVDIIGNPRARQVFCEQVFSFEQPWFLRTINGYGPDEYGDFKILANDALASDTVLRIESQSNGLGFKLVGKVLANAPD